MQVKPKYLIEESGKKVAVQLTIEEYEFLSGKGGHETPAVHFPYRTARKKPTGKPISFEMHEEFCSAKGTLLPDGASFKVLAGSKASGIVDKTLDSRLKHDRDELIMLRVLVRDDDSGEYYFDRDYEFANPSTAASIVAGSERDGGVSWISPDTGQILDSI